MKTAIKPQQLKILILGAGILGFALRSALYTIGIDEKGLLVTNHWATVVLCILTAAVAVALLLLTRSIQGPERYCDCYPVSAAGAAGCFAAAAAFVISAIEDIPLATRPQDLFLVALGFLSAAAMAAVGVCRLLRIRPLFALHGVTCLYLALRMINRYQYWSADPELMDYCFYMGAYVMLMLSCYQLAAFDVGVGNHKKLWLLGLAAVYLCCLSLVGGGENLSMAAWGGWIFTNLTNLTVKPRRRRAALVLEDDPPAQEV